MENERGTHDSNFLLIQRNPQHVQGKKGLLRQKQECEESAPRTFPFPTALVVFCIVLSRKKTSFLRLLFFADFPSSTARERSAAPMSMIKVEDLTFSYPASHDRIFDSVSFQIDTNWKLGFVGRNGRGKTTFLQLLMGNYPYQGTIVSSVPFDYFPYPVADQTQWTQDVLQSVCPQAQSWELLRELSYLDVDPEVLFRPFATLSKGEQTKVLLAALFLKEGHFLLIDEPTNHLDTQARDLVSAYLRRKQGFILVSHDRHFLDGCVDHILSLNRANITVQNGTFSTWLENFNRQQAFEQAQKEGLQKDIARLRKAARQTSVWSDRIEEKKYGAGPVDRGYIGHPQTLSPALPGRPAFGGLFPGQSPVLRTGCLRPGLLCPPSRRTGGSGWEKREWEKQPAQGPAGGIHPTQRHHHHQCRLGGLLCPPGHRPPERAVVPFRGKTPFGRESLQRDSAKNGV